MFKLADVDEFELLLPKDIWAAADAVISTAVRTSKEIFFHAQEFFVKIIVANATFYDESFHPRLSDDSRFDFLGIQNRKDLELVIQAGYSKKGLNRGKWITCSSLERQK